MQQQFTWKCFLFTKRCVTCPLTTLGNICTWFWRESSTQLEIILYLLLLCELFYKLLPILVMLVFEFESLNRNRSKYWFVICYLIVKKINTLISSARSFKTVNNSSTINELSDLIVFKTSSTNSKRIASSVSSERLLICSTK